MRNILLAAATAIAAGFLAAGTARADQGTVSNIHVGLGRQQGLAVGGCVAFDLIHNDGTASTPPTSNRYAVGGAQLAGPLYQWAILTHDGKAAGLDPVPDNTDCPWPAFKNLNFPAMQGQ